MSLIRNLTTFSENGEYLAYSSPDGCLKIWESSTGILKQEYTPSSHLSATCSSLAWGPFADNHHASKRFKKSKRETFNSIANLRIIAIGTMTGDILLYSFANADLYTSLSNGHTSVVNDVIWHSNMLYSCSNDNHIIIWDICSGKIKTKWKASVGAVYSICVIDDNNILSADSSIQWWDIKHKTVKKTFNGHGSEIFRLLPVITKGGNNYFLSAAVGDRVINLWELQETSSKSALASFVLSDEPTNINILVKQDEPFQMSAVSQDGIFNFFEHTLNGKLRKPLQPKFTAQIASKTNDGQKPCSIQILAANISDGLDYCLISYGNFLNPIFERIDISGVSENLFFIRNLSLFKSASAEDNITKIKQPEKPNNVKLLAPGHMTDVGFSERTSKKRKKKGIDIKELPMEERLKALDLNKTPKEALEDESTVKCDSLVHLLLQGLQSKDINMLNTVLSNGDELIIHNTLEKLPIQSIFPLLKVLYERLNKREPRNHPCLKWFTALIMIHLSYFMSCPDISEYLVPFDQLIAARREVVCKMSQAQGVLKILMAQATSSTSNAENTPKPLLEYESELSEESEAEMDPSDDESEDEIVHNTSPASSESSETESEMED